MPSFAHMISIIAYGLISLAAAKGLKSSDWSTYDIPPIAIGCTIFLTLTLLGELLRRRHKRHTLHEQMQQLTRRFSEAQSDIDRMRHDIVGLRREQHSRELDLLERRRSEMELLRNLIEELSIKLGVAQPEALGDKLKISSTPSRNQFGGTILDILREALEESRLDLYLQPIVSLPQRKVRFYECFSRIRDRDGHILAPAEYLSIAEQAGLISTLDNLLLLRCIQLIRRLRRRHTDVGFFVNLARCSLEDEAFISQFVEYLQRNPEILGHLIFEISQNDFEVLSPPAEAAIQKLVELGCRFSLDGVSSLDIDWKLMANRQFRFIKLDSKSLLAEAYQDTSPINLVDLKQLLKRHDIDLIAEKIEAEQIVVNLLDFHVDFGQGYLFGEPRRSRDDA